MLTALKFVQGAVSKKDYVASMSHFNIKNGRITAFNGMFAISSLIDCNIDCNPDADTLVKAISKCTKATQLSLTPTGRLSIKSGAFKALINCHPEQLPEFEPSGEIVGIDGKVLYDALSALYDFISDDATRPWSNGVLIDGKSAYATNNIILVEKWLGVEFPFKVNIPRLAVRELLRVKENPVKIQVDERSVTFHYDNERYIRTQQLDTNWPSVFNVLNVVNPDYQDVDEELFTALLNLKDFSDKLQAVYFRDGYLTTSKADEDGASYHTESSPGIGCYSGGMLLKLKGVAEKIDWFKYPKPCPFIGDGLRGIIVGLRE